MFLWLCDALSHHVDRARSDGPLVWPNDPAEVETLVTLAGHHLATPALALALRGNSSVPGPVSDYLEAALFLNRERNEQMLDGLEIAARALLACGITPVLLKGSASLVDGLYPDLGMRILGDLDLLVPAADAETASKALADAGFDEFDRGSARPVPFTVPHHLPMQSHRSTGVGVELHHTVMPPPFARMLDAQHVLQSAHSITFRGMVLAQPSPTHRVLHNVAHDQLADAAYARRTISLRQLLDLTMIVRRHREAIDWEELSAAFSGPQARVLRYALGLMELFGGALPEFGSAQALQRLRAGIEHPRSHVGIALMSTAYRLLHQPKALLNVLSPQSWPRA